MGIREWFKAEKAQDQNSARSIDSWFNSQTGGGSGQAVVIRDSRQGYIDAYKFISHVGRCVDLLSENASSPNLYLYNRKTGEDVLDHPALDLMGDRPLSPGLDPEITCDRVTKDVLNLLIFGETIWGFPKGTLFQSDPIEAYTLNPLYADHVEGSGGERIKAWNYRPVGTTGTTYSGPSEWLQIKRNDPTNPYRGLSKIKTLIQALGSASYAESYTRDFFENGSVIGSVLDYPNLNATDEQKTEIRRAVREQTTGRGKRGSTLVTFGGCTYTVVTDNLKDAAIEIPDRIAMAKTAEIFGVPEFFLASADVERYATAATAKASLWEENLGPFDKWLANQYTLKLLPFFRDSEDLEFRFDIDSVPALQAKRLETAKALRELVGVPVMTVTEARKILGYPVESEDLDQLYVPLGMVQQGAEPLGPVE